VILISWALSLVRTILNLALVPRLLPRLPKRFPRVSVIVPARDEERTIERTVRALFAQTWPELEIIIVNDRSTDATGAILERLAKEDARLRVIAGVEPPPGWLGKPWALHEGSRHAHGELLLFVDADVIYAPDAITAAVARMEESDVALTSFFPRLEMHGFWEHVAMPNLAMMAFTILPLWFGNRTRFRLLGVGGGPGNLIRREDYDAAGGHEPLKDAVVDDVALARLVRRSGGRSEMVRADDFVSVRMYHGLREVIDGFTKNCFTTFGRSYALTIVVVVFTFVFHVLPYVLALTGDVLAIASVVLLTLVRAILFTSLGYRLDNAVLGNPLMVTLWSWILLRSAWYTGVLKQLHWRGRKYDARHTRFGAD
jgi:glycosyltransferase involved in cell wall biosynthesis